VLVNGWQSWSFAGELKRWERPRRALLRRDLNLFVDHPAERALRLAAQRPHTFASGHGAYSIGATLSRTSCSASEPTS